METIISDSTKCKFKFYPIALNRYGEPEFIEGDRAINVLKRMEKHSAVLGTQFVINGEVGELS